VSPSGFDLALIDDEGNPVTSAEVNWIAIGIGPPNPGVAIQRGWGSYSNGASIPFTYPYFIQPPVVVTSADPSIGTAVNIAANGFDIALIDDGGGTTTAEVDWIALTVGVSTPNTLIQYQRGLSGNGAHITFDTEFGPWPVVIVNARRFGEPLIACAEKVTTAGFDLAIIDHGGNPVTGVWVHWIAIGPPIPPPVTPPPYTPEPSPTPEGTPRP
jgi:hypothetical protein